MIQQRVIQEFRQEVDRSKLPGYRSTYDDYDGDLDVPAERQSARSTQVQPAEPQPPRPHKMPAPQSGTHGPHTGAAQQGAKRDGFGAGIF
jgi:hypothetical protein